MDTGKVLNFWLNFASIVDFANVKHSFIQGLFGFVFPVPGWEGVCNQQNFQSLVEE